MLSTVFDWVRVLNLVLATAAMVHMLRYRAKKPHRMSHGERDRWWLWIVITASLIALSAYGILRQFPTDGRVLFITVITVALVVGIYVLDLWPFYKDEADENLL